MARCSKPNSTALNMKVHVQWEGEDRKRSVNAFICALNILVKPDFAILTCVAILHVPSLPYVAQLHITHYTILVEQSFKGLVIFAVI